MSFLETQEPAEAGSGRPSAGGGGDLVGYARLECKRCSKCGVEKGVGEFHKRKASKDGLLSQCKICRFVARKAWEVANPEKLKAQNKANRTARREQRLAYDKVYREANKEAIKKQRSAYCKANKDIRTAKAREWREANRDKSRAWEKEYREKYPDKAREYARRTYAKNKARYVAAAVKRKLRRKQATPPWADLPAMSAVYEHAGFLKEMGVVCHVDHIIPLKGKLVSGLHVQDNLRIVIDTENLSKGNRCPEDPYGILPAYKLPAVQELISLKNAD